MTSVFNVTINENEEIEYVDIVEETVDAEYDGTYQGDLNIDDDNVLVPSGEGVMTIKMKEKTIVEHVCGKCNKSYKSFGGLKRHMNLCRNLPKIIDKTPVIGAPRDIDEPSVSVVEEITNISTLDDDTCYCCLEKKVTAHVGHIRCNFCPKSFKSHVNLERHLFSVHSATTEYPCTSCNATCPNEDILYLHIESHNEGKPFSCQNCGKDFTRKYHLDRHLLFTGCDKNRPKLVLPCQVCKKIFTRVDNLREHLRGHMGQPTRRKDYKCPHCEKCFYGSSLLNIHIRTHTGEKPFPCDLCDKSFPSNGALRKHRRMHTGEKPYSCKECGKCFSAKETLNRHMKIHTGVRPHACDICGKSFIQATQLRSHMFHHTGEHGFTCPNCSRVFNRKARLEAHIRFVHNKEKLFSCTECKRTFKRQDELNRHLDTHKTIKNFECTDCKKKFSSKASLSIHAKVHIEEEPCKCKVCKRVFIRLDCLMRHMRNKHRDILYDIITDAEQNKITKTLANEKLLVSKVEPIETEAEDDDEDNDNASATTTCYTTYGDEVEDDQPHEEYEIIDLKTESEIDEYGTGMTTVVKTIAEDVGIIAEISGSLNEAQLTENISKLLNVLVDEQTLNSLGWPSAKCEDVLAAVIQQCGQVPTDDAVCPDYVTKMRENAKLLFTTVIDNDSIKSLLNNHTVDEVILHVLKLAT